MPYVYEVEKEKIFTDDGQREFLKVRDHVKELLNKAGAVTMTKATNPVSGDGWTCMAYVDRLVEIGEIREVTNGQVAGQDRVFVKSFGR